MILRKHSTAGLLLAAIIATALPASAAMPSLGKKKPKEDVLPSRKLTAGQNALIDKAIAPREGGHQDRQGARSARRDLHPEHAPDPVLGQVPESDEHFLGRVEFSKIIGDDPYAGQQGHLQGHLERQQARLLQALRLLPERPRRQPAPHLPRGRLRPDAAHGLQQLRPSALRLRLRPQRLPRQHPYRRLRRHPDQRQARHSAASSAASGSKPATAT